MPRDISPVSAWLPPPSAAAPLRLNGKPRGVGGRKGGRWTYNSPSPDNAKATEAIGQGRGKGGRGGGSTLAEDTSSTCHTQGGEVGDIRCGGGGMEEEEGDLTRTSGVAG